MTRVLDASALLAFLHNEAGADRVRQVLDGGLVSTVNWSEVLQKSLRRHANVVGMHQDFAEAGLNFEPFTIAQATTAADLWEKTRVHGLSSADRACLALAVDKSATVLSADRVWTDLALGLDIELLR